MPTKEKAEGSGKHPCAFRCASKGFEHGEGLRNCVIVLMGEVRLGTELRRVCCLHGRLRIGGHSSSNGPSLYRFSRILSRTTCRLRPGDGGFRGNHLDFSLLFDGGARRSHPYRGCDVETWRRVLGGLGVNWTPQLRTCKRLVLLIIGAISSLIAKTSLTSASNFSPSAFSGKLLSNSRTCCIMPS